MRSVARTRETWAFYICPMANWCWLIAALHQSSASIYHTLDVFTAMFDAWLSNMQIQRANANIEADFFFLPASQFVAQHSTSRLRDVKTLRVFDRRASTSLRFTMHFIWRENYFYEHIKKAINSTWLSVSKCMLCLFSETKYSSIGL